MLVKLARYLKRHETPKVSWMVIKDPAPTRISFFMQWLVNNRVFTIRYPEKLSRLAMASHDTGDIPETHTIIAGDFVGLRLEKPKVTFKPAASNPPRPANSRRLADPLTGPIGRQGESVDEYVITFTLQIILRDCVFTSCREFVLTTMAYTHLTETPVWDCYGEIPEPYLKTDKNIIRYRTNEL